MTQRTEFYQNLDEIEKERRIAEADMALADQQRGDMLEVMSHPGGRRVMHFIIWEKLGLQDRTFTYGVKDGHSAALWAQAVEGRREAAITLYHDLVQLDAGLVSLMEQEYLATVADALALKQLNRSSEDA